LRSVLPAALLVPVEILTSLAVGAFLLVAIVLFEWLDWE
jgi:hypothetical protein